MELVRIKTMIFEGAVKLMLLGTSHTALSEYFDYIKKR